MKSDRILSSISTEAVAKRCSVKRVLLKISQDSQENTCARFSFLIQVQASACNFIKKETQAQVFSCEFCEIFKNTIFHRTPPVPASRSKILGQPPWSEFHENSPKWSH